MFFPCAFSICTKEKHVPSIQPYKTNWTAFLSVAHSSLVPLCAVFIAQGSNGAAEVNYPLFFLDTFPQKFMGMYSVSSHGYPRQKIGSLRYPWKVSQGPRVNWESSWNLASARFASHYAGLNRGKLRPRWVGAMGFNLHQPGMLNSKVGWVREKKKNLKRWGESKSKIVMGSNKKGSTHIFITLRNAIRGATCCPWIHFYNFFIFVFFEKHRRWHRIRCKRDGEGDENKESGGEKYGR